jgi:hypothetical protein
VKDLKSITDPAAGSEARRQEGPEAAHAFPGFEPMTIRQLHSVTVSAGKRPRCSARWSVSTPGGCSRGLSSASRHRVDISRGEDAVRSSPQYVGATSPSVV